MSTKDSSQPSGSSPNSRPDSASKPPGSAGSQGDGGAPTRLSRGAGIRSRRSMELCALDVRANIPNREILEDFDASPTRDGTKKYLSTIKSEQERRREYLHKIVGEEPVTFDTTIHNQINNRMLETRNYLSADSKATSIDARLWFETQNKLLLKYDLKLKECQAEYQDVLNLERDMHLFADEEQRYFDLRKTRYSSAHGARPAALPDMDKRLKACRDEMKKAKAQELAKRVEKEKQEAEKKKASEAAKLVTDANASPYKVLSKTQIAQDKEPAPVKIDDGGFSEHMAVAKPQAMSLFGETAQAYYTTICTKDNIKVGRRVSVAERDDAMQRHYEQNTKVVAYNTPHYQNIHSRDFLKNSDGRNHIEKPDPASEDCVEDLVRGRRSSARWDASVFTKARLEKLHSPSRPVSPNSTAQGDDVPMSPSQLAVPGGMFGERKSKMITSNSPLARVSSRAQIKTTEDSDVRRSSLGPVTVMTAGAARFVPGEAGRLDTGGKGDSQHEGRGNVHSHPLFAQYEDEVEEEEEPEDIGTSPNLFESFMGRKKIDPLEKIKTWKPRRWKRNEKNSPGYRPHSSDTSAGGSRPIFRVTTMGSTGSGGLTKASAGAANSQNVPGEDDKPSKPKPRDLDGSLINDFLTATYEKNVPDNWDIFRKMRTTFFHDNENIIAKDVNNILYHQLTPEEVKMCNFLTDLLQRSRLELRPFRSFDSLTVPGKDDLMFKSEEQQMERRKVKRMVVKCCSILSLRGLRDIIHLTEPEWNMGRLPMRLVTVKSEIMRYIADEISDIERASFWKSIAEAQRNKDRKRTLSFPMKHETFPRSNLALPPYHEFYRQSAQSMDNRLARGDSRSPTSNRSPAGSKNNRVDQESLTALFNKFDSKVH